MIDRAQLVDCNGQVFAEFLNLGASGILGYPFMAMMHAYLRDVSLPEWVSPGTMWQLDGFLGYLANVAGQPVFRGGCSYLLRRGGDGIVLSRQMSAERLAQVLSIEAGEVRKVLHNHLTFTEARA